MRRGELWWATPRLPGGSRKRRPMLVVSNDAFNRNERYLKVLVVHVTSVLRDEAFDWEVSVPKGTAGLERRSIIKCAEVYTLLREQLTEQMGTLPRERMLHVDRALALSLGLATPVTG